MGPRELVARAAEARSRVEDHCMCGRLEETPHYVVVYYPPGDFVVDGVRVAKAMGVARAFDEALVRMERHWNESFPGFVPAT